MPSPPRTPTLVLNHRPRLRAPPKHAPPPLPPSRQALQDACADACRQVLGPRRAVALQQEVSLASGLLYYGLTTGCGLQTLGEEYCDLLPAVGDSQRPPGLAGRSALVLLQSVLPYALRAARRGGGRAGGGGGGGKP